MADTREPAPELRSFGEELRKEREIRGISIKEIADATKVSSRFLEAIERNDFDRLPAPVFTRGFIREYARYLGLNSDDAVNRYMQFVEESDATGEKGRFGLRDTGPREDPNAHSQFAALWVILIVAALLAVAALWWWKTQGPATGRAHAMGRVASIETLWKPWGACTMHNARCTPNRAPLNSP